MALTLEQVRARIDVDEPSYPRLAVELGPEAVPHLRTLAAGPDAMLASKATYLASMIGGVASMEVVRTAARRSEPTVRVAAAAALRNLEPSLAEQLAEPLLRDADTGVRHVTLKSAARLRSPALQARVRELAEQDPDSSVRSLADSIVRGQR